MLAAVCPQAKLSLFQLILAKYKQHDLHMSTYSLDIDANTFRWNSSLGVTAKRSVFVCLSGCLWALLVCAWVWLFMCVFNEDLCPCACTVFQVYSLCTCMSSGMWTSPCLSVCVCVCSMCLHECGSFSSQCDWQQPLIGLSPSGPELPLVVFKAYRHRGEEETYRQPTGAASAQCKYVCC